MALAALTCESLYSFAAAWIRDQAGDLRIPLDGPDAVHDQRVATRRLRMACRIFFEDLGGKRWPRQLRNRTRWLGQARQWDVQEALLASLRESAQDPLEQGALEFLQEQARRRRKKAWRGVEGGFPKDLLKGITGFARRLETRQDAACGPLFAWNALHPLLVESFGSLEGLIEAEHPEHMHQTRMAFKRFRYATELLKPSFVRDQEAFLSTAREFQTQLGDHHDLVVLQAFLEAEKARLEQRGRLILPSGLALTLGRLAQKRRGLYEAFRVQGKRVSMEESVRSLRLALGLALPGETNGSDPEVSG